MKSLNSNIIKTMVTVFTVTIFFSCQNNFKEVQNIGILDSGPAAIAENINPKYTVKVDKDSVMGRLKMYLQTPKMLDYSNRRFAFFEYPEGIDLTLYDEKGNENHILANYAIMYNETNLIDLRGDVVISTFKKDTLFTQQLFYDQSKEWMFTNSSVQFKMTDQIINGNGFDSDNNFTMAEVIEVTGLVTIDE